MQSPRAVVSGACLTLVLASALVALPGVAPGADASGADASGEGRIIDLDEALRRTLARNPSLSAYGFQIEAARGQLVQARLRPNPEFGVLVENVLGTGEHEGIESAETTLSLGWVLERGKREYHVASATAGASYVESGAEVRRLDAAAETARLFLDTLANQERLARSREAVSVANETVMAVTERVKAAQTPDADLSRAEAQLARAHLIQEDIQHELLTSMHRLAAQWSETRPDFARVDGDLYRLPRIEEYTVLVARLERSPDLARYLTEQRLRASELALAQAQARPDWQVNVGIRRLEESDDQALLAGMTIPLPVRHRNEGRIAEARARLAGVEADQAVARLGVETRLFALYQELQHSRHRTRALRDEILPRIERALADTRRAYDLGRYDYLTLQQVQAEHLLAGDELVEASVDTHKGLIEIERLTGLAVSTPAEQP